MISLTAAGIIDLRRPTAVIRRIRLDSRGHVRECTGGGAGKRCLGLRKAPHSVGDGF